MALESYNGIQLDDVTSPPHDFEGLNEEECVALMKEWFFNNFEDPVHHDMYVSAEGGYQYIWGGPYDAGEIFWEAFEEALPSKIIEAAVNDVQSDGTINWTVAHSRVQPPEEDIDPMTPFKEMQSKISELEKVLSNLQSKPAGIGHNGPPEPIEDILLTETEITNITININVLKAQEPYKGEDREQIEQAIEGLSSIWTKLGDYFAEKGDIFVNEVVKAAGSEVGKRAVQIGEFYLVYELLGEIIRSASAWIKILW